MVVGETYHFRKPPWPISFKALTLNLSWLGSNQPTKVDKCMHGSAKLLQASDLPKGAMVETSQDGTSEFWL